VSTSHDEGKNSSLFKLTLDEFIFVIETKVSKQQYDDAPSRLLVSARATIESKLATGMREGTQHEESLTSFKTMLEMQISPTNHASLSCKHEFKNPKYIWD